MTPERWQQIDKLLDEALDRQPEGRKAFLEQACGSDEDLRKQVEALLAAHEKAGSFVETPALNLAAQGLARAGTESFVGKKLGPYEVLSLLGRGGMGEVYRARDTLLDRQVALKVLPPQVAEDPQRLRRFVREAKAASALDHPNIATIHEMGEAEGVHYIVMEYVKGETLEARVGKGRLGLAEILDIGIQMVDALDEAHRQGITHRDIKPANIMLTPRGQVKVLDFGLAKRTHQEKPAEGTAARTESHTTPGVIMGTVEYMSPEQVLGQEVDHRTDLFSLGVVLYDLTTGRLPFTGLSSTETMDKILHSQPEAMARFNSETPLELEQIVRKCLEKDRGLRYQHASELCTDLKRLKRDTESGRAAVGPVERRGRSYLWISMIFVLGAILGIAGWYWLVRSRPVIEETPLKAVPLTSYPGREDSPSFSPEGNQVAFSWNGEKQDNYDIYVKQLGVEPPSRLTNDPAPDVSPAWSPDGRTIAFLRQFSPTREALILIPQRGGSERVLEELDLSMASFHPWNGPYLAWTPDSKWLACPVPEAGSGVWTLYLFSVETSEKPRMTKPPAGEGGDTSPAFSPNGRILAFTRTFWPVSDLYLLRLGEGYKPQGEPERVSSENPYNIGVAWTPDGSELVFSSGIAFSSITQTSYGLWRVAASGSAKPRRLPFVSENARAPAISRQGNRLAYAVERSDTNIWRVDLRGPDRKPGVPVRLISSTRSEVNPALSADGKRIAFKSDRSGANEIWLCDSDGSNPEQLTSFGGSVETWGAPRWSPDGKSIALDMTVGGNYDVYVINPNERVPRRLTTDAALDMLPSWSNDGQSLYFRSNRSGSFEIWKMPAIGGNAVQITRDAGADQPHESPDGKFVYYMKGWPTHCSVWRVAVEGSEGTKVLDAVHPEALWTVAGDGIYFFNPPDEKGQSDLSIYEFVTSKTRKILTIDRPVTWSIEVSRDGRTVLYPQVDEAGSDLMLVENFR